MTSSPVFTFTANGVVVRVYAQEYGGPGENDHGVTFTFSTTLTEGYRLDLNGFFLDIGGNGGTIWWTGSNSNNMNGSGADGYDYAAVLGSVGGNDADYHSGSVDIPGITLADLVGSDAGLRATSYSGPEATDNSLKLTASYTPPRDDFPC